MPWGPRLIKALVEHPHVSACPMQLHQRLQQQCELFTADIDVTRRPTSEPVPSNPSIASVQAFISDTPRKRTQVGNALSSQLLSLIFIAACMHC